MKGVIMLQKLIIRRIREIIKEKNLNQYKLYKLTGIPQSTKSTILNGDIKTIKLTTLYDICAGLNLEFTDFFSPEYFKLKNIED